MKSERDTGNVRKKKSLVYRILSTDILGYREINAQGGDILRPLLMGLTKENQCLFPTTNFSVTIAFFFYPPLFFSFSFVCICAILLTWVVRKVDNAIHRKKHYPADSVVCFVNTYPLDSDLSGG